MPQASYAIGPSLYDWEQDKFEEEDLKAEIIDQRFESYFRAWTSCNYADLGCVFTRPEKRESVKEEVSDVVSLAMSNMAWNEEDSKAFNLLLFNTYCNSNEALRAILELLDKYIKPACRELMKENWQSW